MPEDSSEIDTPKPSITATGIISGFHRALATGYHKYFSKEEMELSRHFYCAAIRTFPAMSKERLFLEVLWWAPYSYQQGFFSKMIIPAYDQAVMLRKLMIRQQLIKEIINGLEQLVVLGGGYSTESLVLAVENPNLKVFELDRGPSRQTKVESLKYLPGIYADVDVKNKENNSAIINDNLAYIDCDVTLDSFSEKLIDEGYDPTKKTLILAEGLTAYLTQEQNQQLLRSINEITSDNSKVLIGYINKGFSDSNIKQIQESNAEGHNFFPPPNSVFDFTRENDFCVVGKFNYVDVLPKIGHSNDGLLYKQENSELPIEFYYELEKSSSLNKYSDINDVPVIEIKFDSPALVNNDSSWKCSIL